MKSDIDKHIGRHLKDREFKIYFERAEVKRKIAQEIAESGKQTVSAGKLLPNIH